MKIPTSIKDRIRPTRDIIYAFFGFLYDFYRFFRFAGWRGFHADNSKRDYKAVKIYHRLEKSLSFKIRKNSSGWGAVDDFIKLMKKSPNDLRGTQFHEPIGIKVVEDFANQSNDPPPEVIRFINENKKGHITEGGTIDYSTEKLDLGKLENPENFFHSRYSVRSFKSTQVPQSTLERALNLALKTPSVCNRQAWKVYHLDKRDSIDRALSLQNGNRGFGHEIPCLLVIASDLKAFDTSGERYQHWIDGGMFSMSLILALHSLGLSSCCLNWSKGPIDDIKIRKIINIDSSHTIMMMLAVGFAQDELKVCYSARPPLTQVYKKIG